jgi:DNA recombination protein RmuC
MDSIVALLIVCLLLANLIAVIFLIRRKSTNQIDNSQIFKDEVSSLKNSFSQSFGSMSKEIAKDMTGALTKVDEKVGVFNRQVSELNKSQDNFSKILSGVKTYGTLAEFGLGALLKDLLPASQFIANVKMKEDTSETVEFAIKLQDVMLPIDSHWPVEKYKAIDDAYNANDKDAQAEARKDLAAAFRLKAKAVNMKYIAPPKSTDLRNISSRFDKHFDGIKDLRKKLEQAMTATDGFGRDARSIMNTLSNIKDPQQVKETLEENSEKIKVLK